MNSPIGAPIQERLLTSIALLWLAGVALRLTILAVPPVIPLIHDELNLSATQIGILTGLPSMLFAFAAVPGSLLVARLGISAALVVGLVLTAVGGALRGALPDVTWLYAMTVAMGAGVAIMQVTMPSAVRAWVPGRIGFATAVYTNGLLIGEILPVALMLPLVLPLAKQLAVGLCRLELSGRNHRHCRNVARATADDQRSDAGETPVVARLAQHADLATRHHARQHQRHVLRHQCLHPRLHEE